jgi:hypothetical protein
LRSRMSLTGGRVGECFAKSVEGVRCGHAADGVMRGWGWGSSGKRFASQRPRASRSIEQSRRDGRCDADIGGSRRT